MKYVIRKAFWNYEKEEKWLNEKAARGLALSDYSWCRYVFEEVPYGKYIYRIELLDHSPVHPESINYVKFLEEIGVEFVSSYGNWIYLRKKAADGPFDLYSDIESRILHYGKIYRMWLSLTIAELLIGISNLELGLLIGKGQIGFNAYIGVPLLVLGLFLLFCLVLPLHKKIKVLKREKEIRE